MSDNESVYDLSIGNMGYERSYLKNKRSDWSSKDRQRKNYTRERGAKRRKISDKYASKPRRESSDEFEAELDDNNEDAIEIMNIEIQ